jgi:hypothetical protein
MNTATYRQLRRIMMHMLERTDEGSHRRRVILAMADLRCMYYFNQE